MYYDTCRRYEGKVVKIRDKHGRLHVGKITKVDKDRVWIEPTSSNQDGDSGKDCRKNRSGKKDRSSRCKKSRSKELDDFHNNSYFYSGDGACFDDGRKRRRRKNRGCGYDACRGGFGGGFGGWFGGYPIAFGFITGIALAALFFF
jgi:hypothetical protein